MHLRKNNGKNASFFTYNFVNINRFYDFSSPLQNTGTGFARGCIIALFTKILRRTQLIQQAHNPKNKVGHLHANGNRPF